MAVHVIDTIKPKNNLNFPVVEAEDVKVSDTLRLDEALEDKADTADLTALEAEVEAKAENSALASAVANLQGQIDNIVTPATQDAEVQNARVGADGTSYQTLKARIDSEVNELKTNVEQKVNTKELLDGFKYLSDDDFEVGYLQVSNGQPSEISIRGIYTGFLPTGCVIDVDTTDIKVAKYAYTNDENKTFVEAAQSVSLPNTTPNVYLTRYLIYWSSPGIYTDITVERAKELLPHVSVKTTTLSDYKGSNPSIEKFDIRKADAASAFVSDRKISWKENANCDLLIEGTIRLGIGNKTVQLSTTDLYALADASDIVTLRSDNSIRGYDFALVYDTEDEEFKFLNQSYPSTHKGKFVILFEHYYGSLTGGGLLAVSSYASRIYNLENPTSKTPSYFITEAETTAAAVASAATEPCYAVIFVTDSHHNNTPDSDVDAWKYTSQNIKYLSGIYQFDAIIHGGDLTSGNISKASTIRLTNEIRNALSDANDNVFILMGNHDDNSYKDKTDNYISSTERYGLLHRQSCTKVYTNPDDTACFYYELPEIGLRVIFLNSIIGYGVDSNSNAWGYSDSTLAWFRNTALNTNYQVAIFSHMGFSGEFNGYNLYPKNGVEMRGAVDSFVTNGGTVVGLFHGHNHWDNIAKATGSNLTEIDTACSLCSQVTPTVQGATVPTRNLDDVTADCFDCIVIKPASRTVNLIRFGAGNDRSFTY